MSPPPVVHCADCRYWGVDAEDLQNEDGSLPCELAWMIDGEPLHPHAKLLAWDAADEPVCAALWTLPTFGCVEGRPRAEGDEVG